MTSGDDETRNESVRLIRGGVAVDDRGAVGFVNDFMFEGVVRFYTIRNHEAGFVRAWHAHRRERKFVAVLRGAAVVAAVRIDEWDHPSPDLPIERFVLSEETPSVLEIPPGHANGAMTLTDDALLVYFSTSTTDESRGDDIRYPARYWDPWTVEER